MKNAYQILGIPSTASLDEIKKAFRTLAHLHHPDKGGHAEKFKEVNGAYGEINTSEKQQKYNVRMSIGRFAQHTNSHTQYSYSSRENTSSPYMQKKMTAQDILMEMLKMAQHDQAKASLQYNKAKQTWEWVNMYKN